MNSSMNNDDDENNNNNWLGFSLSPHLNMETHPSSASSVSSSVPTSHFHSPHQINYGIFYGVEGENCGLYSPLSMMPLKSDGSLCIMEALGRSQSQAMVTTSTPKLEDFFGGASMETHHYENHEQIQAQQYPFYSGFRSHEMLLEEENKHPHLVNINLQPPSMADDGISRMKNWVSRNYPMSSHALEQNMISCMGENGGESGSMLPQPYGDLQSLSLSMSPGSQSSCVTGSQQISPAVTECFAMETKKRGAEKGDQKQIVHRKSIDTFGQRTSQYRGVTRHRWTGRYEAHLWDNSCKKEGQSRKGRQVYLGGYDLEEKAARAYDLAALKYWGPSTHINFPLENYQPELEGMKNMSRQEYVAHLRRKSSGFSRGASMYRGVTRHHQHGRWQARIGRVAGNKDLYLGTFGTQEEAAEAYDVAAIKFRGVNAVTNFDITRYDVEQIMASNTLLTGDLAKRNKETGSGNEVFNHKPSTNKNNGEAMLLQRNNETESNWKTALYQSSQQLEQNPKTHSFPVAPDDMISINTTSSAQQENQDLVTSLSSSREGSPDKTSLPIAFAMPPSTTSKLFSTPTNPSNSWIPTAQLRPAVSMLQMPVFAAWTDAWSSNMVSKLA